MLVFDCGVLQPKYKERLLRARPQGSVLQRLGLLASPRSVSRLCENIHASDRVWSKRLKEGV